MRDWKLHGIGHEKIKKLGVPALVIFLAIASVGGAVAWRDRQEQVEESLKESRIQESLESSLAESSVEESLRQERLASPELSQSQRELLDQMEEAVKSEDYETAARLLLEQGERFWVLYYDVMGGQPYLYRDGALTNQLEGSGLVLRKPSTVYLGELKNGKPDGEGTALQAVELDYPRYDFAVGQWKAGKMDGEGQAGYCYYDGAGEENRDVYRQGMFVDDRMEGAVHYCTVNAQGDETEWEVTVQEGKILLDENWNYDETRKVYQLPSKGDMGHAYVVAEESIEDVRFQNVIVWE